MRDILSRPKSGDVWTARTKAPAEVRSVTALRRYVRELRRTNPDRVYGVQGGTF